MKVIIATSFLLISLIGYSQIISYPDLTTYETYIYTDHYETYKPNPDIFKNEFKVEYRLIQDTAAEFDQNGEGQYFRIFYFDSIRIKSIMVVNRYHVTDTIWVPKQSDPDYDTMLAYNGYLDIANGKYREYHDDKHSTDTVLLCKGQFKDNSMVGHWIKEHGRHWKVEANYNNFGYPEGKYIEYAYNIHARRLMKIEEGNWGEVKIQMRNSYIERHVPIGSWKHWDRYTGEFLGAVKYEWNIYTED